MRGGEIHHFIIQFHGGNDFRLNRRACMNNAGNAARNENRQKRRQTQHIISLSHIPSFIIIELPRNISQRNYQVKEKEAASS
jgi:hypothetical protein